ncbi:hypothetical protein GCM10010250_10120 [Streptomyces althioticus]|nr:hypothetical protein GCM10010250_10120 [Streptomyces althioticus]
MRCSLAQHRHTFLIARSGWISRRPTVCGHPVGTLLLLTRRQASSHVPAAHGVTLLVSRAPATAAAGVGGDGGGRGDRARAAGAAQRGAGGAGGVDRGSGAAPVVRAGRR